MKYFFTLIITLFSIQLAFAYLGPGGSFSTIGAFFALLGGLIVAIFGFVWYPTKRLIKAWKKRKNSSNEN